MALAMDFIEDHIVKNSQIDHNLKLSLLYSQEMAPFSFLGALYHLAIAQQNQGSTTASPRENKE